MSEAKDKNLGVYHVHRFHILNKSGHILCGMVSNKKLEIAKDPEQVNCKLCIKKMRVIAEKLRNKLAAVAHEYLKIRE